MRVLLDTTFARRAPLSGTGVYLERVQTALAELSGLEVIPVANPRRRAPAGGGIGSLRNALADQWWTQFELPRRARAARADLIHHPLPAHCRMARLPQVVTVHDLAFERLPEHFDRSYRTYAHLTHRAAARRAAAVICVSEATAADVRALWGVTGDRVIVAPHGPGQRLPELVRATPRHFLYVGDDEPRKNVSVLIAAYRAYREACPRPLELVLAGSVRREGAGVRTVGAPSPAQLAKLYAGAAALVHPAAHEGFGLTLLEAMGAGTPVIAAETAAAVEVCGDAVRWVVAGESDSLLAALIGLAGDRGAQAQLSHHGRERARRFSWTGSAHRHLEAYSSALRR